jgi:hypothetical protein
MRASRILGALGMLLTLGAAVLVVPASGVIVYGPDGPPNLERLAAQADRIVIGTPTVRLPAVPCERGMADVRRGEQVWTRVDLLIERTLVVDSLGELPDTVFSYMPGHVCVDRQGRVRSQWHEDEPFNHFSWGKGRFLIFLRQMSFEPEGITARPLYRPEDSYFALCPIVEGDTVRNLQLKPGEHRECESLPLAECVKRILAARAAPRPAPPRK